MLMSLRRGWHGEEVSLLVPSSVLVLVKAGKLVAVRKRIAQFNAELGMMANEGRPIHPRVSGPRGRRVSLL